MRFGKTLARSVYPPWKDKYIDYAKLKSLLREDQDDDGVAWTEDDENRFCDEIFNVQLEKVAQFQQERVDDLKQRLDAALEQLKRLTQTDAEPPAPREDVDAAALRKLESELDDITNEVNQLKKYSGDNYTGFLKIVKKHDRKRGNTYRVRPMMQLSLAQRPFNSQEAYSPLLNKLSIMYFAIRQQLDEGDQQAPLGLDNPGEVVNGERYAAHKC
jgi:SPX domain protein involved in polyphosphate accumulation